MQGRLTAFVTTVLLFGVIAAHQASADFNVGFEDKTLPANSFDNGAGGSGGFTSEGAFFNNSYVIDSKTGFAYWSGWALSNVNDTTTAGFGNQYAAITGTGVGGGGNYAVAFIGSPNDAYINLPDGTDPVSVNVTNTTYAYLSMLNGDSFAKKFTTGDFFKLEITGFRDAGGIGAKVGVVDYFLADYTSSGDKPLNSWGVVDLSSLLGAKSLSFGLSSSDNGTFGMNTPATFALDDLRLSVVPEPTSLLLLASGLLGCWMIRARGRSASSTLI
ncbi:MAG: DUF4465 domain-containing protein [Isosphaeraceae bacterium]